MPNVKHNIYPKLLCEHKKANIQYYLLNIRLKKER